MLLPELIVFDLDFTLWDCGGTWCDCLTPPFRRDDDRIFDSGERHIEFYPDVFSILDFCDNQQIVVSLASRTEQPSWARQLLDLLQASDCFPFSEIYPSSKLKHFRALRDATGTAYDRMLFFDDEMRNIRAVSELGVTCVHVNEGMSMTLFEDGLARHAANCDKSGS